MICRVVRFVEFGATRWPAPLGGRLRYASGYFDNWILSIDMEQADAQETIILRHHCWLKTVPTTSFDRAGLCERASPGHVADDHPGQLCI